MAENLKIACLLADGFEDSELRIPYDRLTEAGYDVDVIGIEKGKRLVGKQGKERIVCDLAIDDAMEDDYVGLLLPGGHSPDILRADPRFVAFVKDFAKTGKPLAAVCHGPQLLISAGLVQGRTLTAWKTIQDDLRRMGANVRDEEVVIDRNFITSRKPDDLEAFSDAFIEKLGEEESAESERAGEGAHPTV